MIQGRKTVREGKEKLKEGLDRWREEGVECERLQNVIGAFAWPVLGSMSLLISAILPS